MKTVTTSVGFQDPLGNLVLSGNLVLTLSQAAEVTSGGGLIAPKVVVLPLNATTAKIASTQIWFNDELTPTGTVYHSELLDSGGNIIADFGQWSITGASADLSTMVPVTSATVSLPGVVLTAPATDQTISQHNLTISNNLAVSGALTASKGKNIGAVRYVDTTNAAGWTGADPGAWINSAIADLPASGGVIEIEAGTYACTTAITINKPVTLRGQGTLGTTTSTYSSFVRCTVLQNQSTANDLITITIPAATFMSSAILKDFCVEGNQFFAGATAGSNIRILGGSGATVIRDILIDNVLCFNAFQAGVRISNNSFLINLRDVKCVNNNGDGILVDATTGTPSQIWLTNVDSDLNTGAALHISAAGGGNGGDVYCFGGTFSDSAHGIQLDNGSTARISCFGTHFEHNTNDACHIFGSSGHYFSGCFFYLNTTNDFNLSSVGQGFTTCMAQIQGCAFNSAPATANINIAASCNSVIIGVQNGIGGGSGYTVVDAGFETQRHDKAIHKFFASQYLINALVPSIKLADTTPAQATPNKFLNAKSGVFAIGNSASNANIFVVDDTGNVSPGAPNTATMGIAGSPWLKFYLGTAATNNFVFTPAATAAARTVTINDPLGNVTMPFVIASGTSTLTANATLAAVTSQAAITTAATGAATTDAIEWAYASAPGAGDSLCIIQPYVTANNVNFVRSNPTAAAQNVSAIVINWRVIR